MILPSGKSPKSPLDSHRVGFWFMKLNEAIEKFSNWRKWQVKKDTVRGYDLILKQFCLFVRNCDIEHIRLEDVLSWFSLLEMLQYQRNSFIPKAQALKKFFEFYKMQGFVVLEPDLIRLPSKEYKIPRVASEENYRKLLSAIPKQTNDPRHIRNRAIIMLLWDTGARNGEITALDLEDVNTEQMRAVIKTEKSKGRRPFRELFWTKETNEALQAWIEKREFLKKTKMPHMEECLFPSICSGALNLSGKRITNKGVAEFLRRYSNRANIPYQNAHSFRHHMAHDIISQGGSAADVMNILGHASLSSSSIYTMMTGKELENRYNIFKRKPV